MYLVRYQVHLYRADDVAGWEPYFPHDLTVGYVSWVGSVRSRSSQHLVTADILYVLSVQNLLMIYCLSVDRGMYMYTGRVKPRGPARSGSDKGEGKSDPTRPEPIDP